MRLLVLGGTVFLSKAIAAEAVRARTRGRPARAAASSGPVPDGRPARRLGPQRAGAGRARWPRRSTRSSTSARHPSCVRSAVATLPRRPLGLRLHGQRLPRRVDARAADRPRCRCSSRCTTDEDISVGARDVRRDEGRLRADRARRRRLVDGGAARADRRAGRPERAVHLLAGAAGAGGRRRRGAGAAAPRRPGAGDRRPRPGGLDRGACRAAAHRGVRRGRAGHCRSATCWPRPAAGSASDRSGRGCRGLPGGAGRRAVGGRPVGCRCGCRGRSTTG